MEKIKKQISPRVVVRIRPNRSGNLFAAKVALVPRLRGETTMTVGWIQNAWE
jgi:hypothetical protein